MIGEMSATVTKTLAGLLLSEKMELKLPDIRDNPKLLPAAALKLV